MIFLTIINLNIARFLNIWIVSWILNEFRTQENQLTNKHKMVMMFSGLRGAMAYALALKSTLDFVIGPIILIVTLIYSIISILFMGSLINPVLEYYDVKNQ